MHRNTRRARALVAACGLPALAAAPAAAFTPPAAISRPSGPGLDAEHVGAPLPGPVAVRQRPERDASARPRRARLTKDGRAVAPPGAPARVRQIIRAANRIAHTPYVWGGGHGSWKAAGYDCSGSVGYALHGADLLDKPVTSGDLASFGRSGRGRWVTVYAHGGHTYMVVAGLRFDTSARKRSATRWARDSRAAAGYAVRHPAGL